MADRLISADALKANFPKEDWDYPVYCPSEICELIDSAPTVEAEPIKHGRWEHYKTEILDDDIMGGEYRFKHFRCSECRFDVGGNIGFRYCPNCGAKMDGVENGN